MPSRRLRAGDGARSSPRETKLVAIYALVFGNDPARHWVFPRSKIRISVSLANRVRPLQMCRNACRSNSHQSRLILFAVSACPVRPLRMSFRFLRRYTGRRTEVAQSSVDKCPLTLFFTGTMVRGSMSIILSDYEICMRVNELESAAGRGADPGWIDALRRKTTRQRCSVRFLQPMMEGIIKQIVLPLFQRQLEYKHRWNEACSFCACSMLVIFHYGLACTHGRVCEG